MEWIFVGVVLPIYWGLYKINGRLTRVETLLNNKGDDKNGKRSTQRVHGEGEE